MIEDEDEKTEPRAQAPAPEWYYITRDSDLHGNLDDYATVWVSKPRRFRIDETLGGAVWAGDYRPGMWRMAVRAVWEWKKVYPATDVEMIKVPA